MKTFTVYEHPHLGRQAVKEGFTWPAFFFSFVWAWVKGMAAVGFAIFGAYLGISMLLSFLNLSIVLAAPGAIDAIGFVNLLIGLGLRSLCRIQCIQMERQPPEEKGVQVGESRKPE